MVSHPEFLGLGYARQAPPLAIPKTQEESQGVHSPPLGELYTFHPI